MTNEHAIKLLQHCGAEAHCKHFISTHNCDGCNMMTALNMAIEALSEPKTGWIPVSERLPEVDVKVLTTTDWSDVLIAWIGKGGAWETEEYILDNDEILAWMPLPEPYREDVEE